MSQYPRDEDFYKNLPAYQDIQCGFRDSCYWGCVSSDEPSWWLDEGLNQQPVWKFRHKDTHEPISKDQFRYICEREIAIRETKQEPSLGMQEFSTGAIREAKKGKGSPVFLLCGFPHTLTELHKHMDNPLGRNWEKGIPLSSFVNGAFRHFLEELSGNGDEKSLISMIWNMMCYAETKHRIQNGTLPAELDDVDRNRYSEIKYASNQD